MHSQNCHKAPQKKNEKPEKLGEGVFFKKITFLQRKKSKRKIP